MKVTVKEEEVRLKEGDIIKSEGRNSYYIVALDVDDKLTLTNLTTFRTFSEKYNNSKELLGNFFMKGYTIFPVENNELLIGGK